jgi:protein SERAC1
VSNYCASIVFVHGLTGGQITTWSAEGANVPWPKLLLSEDIPEARISAFGYDADVVKVLGQTSQNNIRQHANNLLSSLADMRFDSNTVGAILMILAHCSCTVDRASHNLCVA